MLVTSVFNSILYTYHNNNHMKQKISFFSILIYTLINFKILYPLIMAQGLLYNISSVNDNVFLAIFLSLFLNLVVILYWVQKDFFRTENKLV